jgi:hypothetical protein
MIYSNSNGDSKLLENAYRGLTPSLPLHDRLRRRN